MTPEQVDSILTQNPKLRPSRDLLEAMAPGSWCVHRSWGLGQIKEFNEAEGKLIIDFEDGKAGHAMDPVFCIKHLEILPTAGLLVRYKQNPAELDEMMKKDPAAFTAEILKELGDEAPGAEIERNVARLIGPTKAKKWWTAAKKLLVKDPNIGVPKTKTGAYVLREEPIKAEDEVLEEFYLTKSAKKQIEHASKLLSLSVDHDDIAEKLPDILKTLTAGLQNTKQLKKGERLHGIWVRNDLARNLHEDVEQLEPTSASIIQEEIHDLTELAGEIPSTHYKRFLDLLYRTLPDDWEKTIFNLLKFSEGKFTNECILFLVEKDCGPRIKETLERWLDEQNLRAPILLWIVKNRNSRKYSKMVHNMIGPRLLHAIFAAIDTEALLQTGNRRIPLAEYLSDDPEIIPELLAEATPETARDLGTRLQLNQGFEGLTKRSLLARFIKLFPNVQSLVDSGAEASEGEKLIVSKKSLELRHQEYEHLIKVKIPENKVAIQVAREHGDLKENSEYKMARQDQDTLLARKQQLESDFAKAQSTDFTEAAADRVSIGSVVTLRISSTGESVTYSILGAWDSSPEDNVLSYKTPLGQSLLSKRIGETVQTKIDGNEENWTIEGIQRWVDMQTAAAATS